MNFLLGLVIMAFGFFMVIKSEDFLRNFGRISFFDRHLGTDGGSRLGYKVIGIIIIIIGCIIFFNFHERVINTILGPLIRLGNI